ncbi:MAG: hypothetical protein MUP36_04455, partial [Demequinaceae bacterium]|nr:hypothetical protein [Demequinaceae bacterium]
EAFQALRLRVSTERIGIPDDEQLVAEMLRAPLDDLQEAFLDAAADPEFTAVIGEADAVEPIVLDYVLQTCGIDLSASSDSGTIEDILKADVSTLGTEMAAYYVDWSPGNPQPVITISENEYYLNGVPVGAQSTGVALTDQYALGPADWCVEVTADGNPGEVYSYSAMHGLQPKSCASL